MNPTDIAISLADPIYGHRAFTLDDAEHADLVELSDLVSALLAEADAVAAVLD